MSSSTRRASAATRRIGQPSVCSASDPPDPPWSTVTSVLPITQLVRVVGHVELVGHDLAERRAGALAEIGLADVEGRGVVLADDDPRVELAEVGVGIRTGPERRAAGLRRGERIGFRQRHGAEADDEQAGVANEVSA